LGEPAHGSISKSGEGVKQKKRRTSPAAADRPLKKAKITLRIAEVRCIDRKAQREAIHFLTNGGEEFRFWCRALNLHPEKVRSELKKRLAGS